MSHEMVPSTLYPVLDAFRDQAHLRDQGTYEAMYQESVNDPAAFWSKQAERIDWIRPWKEVFSANFHTAQISWFAGATLNVSWNCLDRHLATRGDQVAIIWEQDEPGHRSITYRELHADVCRIANVLRAHGIGKGDRVCLYLPMIPELAAAMLACTRIGAIHSIVFAGFSSESVRDRLIDSTAKAVITANEGLRGGKTIPLKEIVDRAVDGLDFVNTVLVATRTDRVVPMTAGRDFDLAAEMAMQRPYCPAAEMDAEDPLFMLYTSGSTGKPKGLLHTTGGYLVHAATTHHYVFDYREGDIYFCAADIGWITGHSYIIYGPLANGATTVMFESTPLYPNPGRYWDVIDRHKVSIFYTAPTAIRALEAEGSDWVTQYDRSSLRLLGSVGEPINPEPWSWYYHVVGNGKCPIVDTWWQTETGGIMITPLPGLTDLKPGSATRPFFGVQPVVVNESGQVLEGNGISGHLCIKAPWPGMARTIYGDHARFIQTYFSTYPGLYFTGDGCRRDEDGYYWITGRVDDVLNVSGHRIGTAEIENSINTHIWVAESAVVGYPHPIKGTGIFAYVILHKDARHQDDMAVVEAVRDQVTKDIGKIARPDLVLITPGLPKTRSGKIMRRILRKISEHEYEQMGNITTLADPSVVELLIAAHRKLIGE